MGRLGFVPFRSMYRAHLEGETLPEIPEKVSMDGFYERFPEAARRVYEAGVRMGQWEWSRAQYLLQTDVYQANFEQEWHKSGAPAYRVWQTWCVGS